MIGFGRCLVMLCTLVQPSIYCVALARNHEYLLEHCSIKVDWGISKEPCCLIVITGVSVVFVDVVSVGGVGVGDNEYVKPNWGLVKGSSCTPVVTMIHRARIQPPYGSGVIDRCS